MAVRTLEATTATQPAEQAAAGLLARLFARVEIAPLVFFRVFFGAVMLWEVWRYFEYNRIERYFIEPQFTFPYFGFEWVKPLPGDGMIWLFHGLGALSVLLMLGLGFRVVMPLFFAAFSYVFLLDQTWYLNHFYLISLVSFIMIFLPLNRALSLDALLSPRLRAQTAPAWTLWLLRAQVGIVYFFGGIAKLNGDWLQAEPMRAWLAARTDFPLIGHLFTEEWMVYAMNYGGLLLDLLIVPFLLWRRTRWLALAAAILFHLMNDRLFNIGIFPWFMIGATLLFLQPERFRWLIPARWRALPSHEEAPPVRLQRRHYVIAALLGLYLLWQVAFPLRHFLYPGDVNWTEEGHKFAWHMKLRSKDGHARFFATDPDSGTTWEMAPSFFLTPSQMDGDKMAGHADMIVPFVHYLADYLRSAGFPNIEIRVWAMATMNGRAPQLLLDPTHNLANQPRLLTAAPYILPLAQPLKGEHHVLLIASREDNLLLVNMTRRAFPLERLRLENGLDTLDGAGWGMAHLEEAGCAVAQPAAGSPLPPLICNQDSAPLLLENALWREPFDVYFDGARLARCESATCVVSVPVAGASGYNEGESEMEINE